jgi:hypothetical protein
VTGCLERASGSASSPTGTSGAAGASSSSAKFVLNNASSGSSSSASSPGTAGTAGAASKSASAGSSYQLDGDDSKLTPHVGHKVEISGTVEGSAGAKKLKVDAVKMIASSCTP